MGAYLAYVTGGSESTLSDPVQYYFNWGDGTNSGWLATGTVMAAHSWAAAGTYNVTARARCATHTAIMSAFSTAFIVRIYNEPTWVGISRFAACASESQPTVEWHTASETGAVGFNLWRQDRETKEYELVNPSLLPALPNSPQGGVYRFADPGAFPGEPVGLPPGGDRCHGPDHELWPVHRHLRRILNNSRLMTLARGWARRRRATFTATSASSANGPSTSRSA